MSDINQLIAKHFTGQTTPQEEELVKDFITENPKEYDALEKLWSSKLSTVKDFDHEAAWKKVVKQSKERSPIRKLYLRVASAAAVFLILAASTIYYQQSVNKDAWEVVQNDGPQPLELALPDGSVVSLRADGQISYPSTFATDLREIRMQGEVFFEAARDIYRPFKIETPHAEVTVLGTSFNIDCNEEDTEVSVATGKVEVKSVADKKSVILIKDESARVSKTSLLNYSTEDLNLYAWKTGVFRFENESITTVIDELNDYYEKRLVLKSKEQSCLLSTTFDNLKLEDVVEIIKVTCNIESTESNNTYELY